MGPGGQWAGSERNPGQCPMLPAGSAIPCIKARSARRGAAVCRSRHLGGVLCFLSCLSAAGSLSSGKLLGSLPPIPLYFYSSNSYLGEEKRTAVLDLFLFFKIFLFKHVLLLVEFNRKNR